MPNLRIGKNRHQKGKCHCSFILDFFYFARFHFNINVKLLLFLTPLVFGFSFMFTNSAVCSCTLLELQPNNMSMGIAAKAGMLQTVFTLVAVNARTPKEKMLGKQKKSQAEHSQSELKALEQAKYGMFF